jgi:hypothetical protein
MGYMPRELRYPQHFTDGEMSLMNYVMQKKEAFDGIRIERRLLIAGPGTP